jgi:hypothetical protein
MNNYYTNAVLTVIAVALTTIAIENLVRPSRADFVGVQQVEICDSSGIRCAGISGRALRVSNE